MTQTQKAWPTCADQARFLIFGSASLLPLQVVDRNVGDAGLGDARVGAELPLRVEDLGRVHRVSGARRALASGLIAEQNRDLRGRGRQVEDLRRGVAAVGGPAV